MRLRRAQDRGHADHGWLRSAHTFSFADYHDVDAMGFRSLRVINEDRVAPGMGFPTHGHRDMEILSYVLDGALEHKDSLGTAGVIRPGDIQRMSAGTGVRHSEHNASRTDPVHFLQIWILPDRPGHAPGYAQVHVPAADKDGRLRLIAAPDAGPGAVTLHQDARLYAGLFGPGQQATHTLAPGRAAWVHLARGTLTVNGAVLHAGDAAAIAAGPITLSDGSGAEVLLFDLA
jgi:redox-sensitive bicupin YhaK (pirin superfamily)